MSSSKIDELEKRIAKIERDKEDRELVEKVISHERSGLFKSIINLGKIIAALILIFTAGDQAMEVNWIKELIK